MQWLQENWALLTTCVLVAVRVVESVIQATASTKDDEIWAVIKKVIGIFFKLS